MKCLEQRNIQIETKDINKKNETTQDVVITASLSPSLSPELKEPVVYEMFGTDRKIESFKIFIHHNQ